ncbi:apolipoprotein N-acyltransferase [Sphingomonas sp.]|uniref:apolipoprotein N-acyltransferase n=1 Tax=Sphingomonas sp. TaxID=28214 RepID=UPI00286CD818|nr:apolipoprotein N-acyltransferase [Sphingomonas sp.]
MHLLFALALGLCSAFAFQPFGWWPLMPLAIAGLFELIARAPTQRRAIGLGWWFAVGQFCIGLNWIATAFTFQAAMPAWLGWVAVVALSLYLAIYPMLATGLAWRIGRDRPAVLVLALAGAWIVNEWLRATMFTGFAWNPVGAILVDSRLLDASRWIGTYGLGALVVLSGGALWLAWRRAFRPAALIAAAVLAFMLVPTATLQPAGTPRPIRIVQPNIGQDVKWRPGFENVATTRLKALNRPRDHRQELIFWPEAAVTTPLSDNRPGAGSYVQQERNQATALVTNRDVLLTGGIALRSKDGRVSDSAANSVFILGPGGRFIGRYDKAHLVPYGEYLPMRPILSAIGLSRLAPGDGDFDAGPGPSSLQLPEGWGKAGFQLCYEIIFSGHVVDRANRPDFLFNPSNDAWFGRWGPPQHLAQARLRAAEEGIPVVRSTPNGISALVDAHGHLIESLPWHRAGIIWADLPRPAASPGAFARYGNAIPLLLALAMLIAAIALRRSRR